MQNKPIDILLQHWDIMANTASDSVNGIATKLTSNGTINSAFSSDEAPDVNQNTKRRLSAVSVDESVRRRPSYAVSPTTNTPCQHYM